MSICLRHGSKRTVKDVMLIGVDTCMWRGRAVEKYFAVMQKDLNTRFCTEMEHFRLSIKDSGRKEGESGGMTSQNI